MKDDKQKRDTQGRRIFERHPMDGGSYIANADGTYTENAATTAAGLGKEYPVEPDPVIEERERAIESPKARAAKSTHNG